VSSAPAHAKINLALVVGPRRPDGLHEVATVLQRVELADGVELEPAAALAVEGFAADTLVRGALRALADAAGCEPRWRVVLEKRVPVAAGLGGGSSDAATALVLANQTLADPLLPDRLAAVAASVGADVPFFLTAGAQLAEGAGERLRPVDVPRAFAVLLALPPGARKTSTAAVYERFDALGGAAGFAARRERVLAALEAGELGALPPNDLTEAAGRPALVNELLAAGAFRADVTGAGPAVYALFASRDEAAAAAAECEAEWVCVSAPVC